MKRLILAAMLCAMPLAGCATLPTATPAAVADKTVLDEKAALAIELAYQAASRAVFFAAKAGVLTPAQKALAADLDNRAYAAVKVARAAYATGNATSYANAVTAAYSAVSQLHSIIK